MNKTIKDNMKHKIELTFDSDESKELFIAWVLDAGGEYNLIEHFNDVEGVGITVDFIKDKDRIDIKSLD